MPAPPVVNRERLAAVDAYTHLGGRMIRIFTRPGQNIDDELSNCDGALNSLQFGVVWLCDNGVQPLIMEVYKNRIHALEDSMNRAVVKVQEILRCAGGTFRLQCP